MSARGGAVVTGAGGGLGREIAVRLGAVGFHVLVTDVDEASAHATAAEITGAGGTATGRRLDVRDQAAARDAARAAVERAGSLALWVNNAGILVTGPVWDQDDEQRRLMFEVNALGTMHGTVAALEVMRPAHRGHIVNVASLAGLVSVPGEGVYAATKHAVVGLSTSTLADLRAAGERDIHISCLCPDGMWTPMLHDRLDDPGASMSFSGQLLQPADVADAVLALIDRPRPVLALPRWRGVEVRLFDLVPSLAMRAVPLVVRLSRIQQRAAARRLRRQ
ncbi:SDR family NAD(P)-dependent oxidoreductase [Knoellia sp. LjRoot47]|uniref:SDR family NAD(P)-dependent oxidoreductase n=1 Tax=Knoellia sp. LjRoot47 TaxID=3342330 RepID=UPI003ECDEA74